MNKQLSDREEFENGVGDEMFSHFYEPYQQNHKDEVWAWIQSKIESKQKEMAMKQAVELANLDQQITILKAERKQAKIEIHKDLIAIADEYECEIMRKEVERYFNN